MPEHSAMIIDIHRKELTQKQHSQEYLYAYFSVHSVFSFSVKLRQRRERSCVKNAELLCDCFVGNLYNGLR
jgi:hypothetical protein